MPRPLSPDLLRIVTSAIEAVQPAEFVRGKLRREGDRLLLGGEEPWALPVPGRIFAFCAGKAALATAEALREVLSGGRAAVEGVALVPRGTGRPVPGFTVLEASHPVPDVAGVAAAREALGRLAGEAGRASLVAALSGGASSLLCVPAEGVTWEDKAATTRRLLACGASIGEINAVRKHLSAVKGGRLRRAIAGAPLLTLLISDVPGDDPATIASGPTVPDPTTFAGALGVLEKYGLPARVPARVCHFLAEGAAGRRPDTPKPGDSCFRGDRIFLLGSNRDACRAAAAEAERLGYRAVVLSSRMGGDVAACAAFHLDVALEIAASGLPVGRPACLVSGGEAVVTVRGGGRGGRNQEFVLHLARGLADAPVPMAAASVGTDGVDGPTDAAGAWADGTTLSRGLALGMDPGNYLRRNDSWSWFQALGDLVRTGPTGTNVADLRVLLIE